MQPTQEEVQTYTHKNTLLIFSLFFYSWETELTTEINHENDDTDDLSEWITTQASSTTDQHPANKSECICFVICLINFQINVKLNRIFFYANHTFCLADLSTKAKQND